MLIIASWTTVAQDTYHLFTVKHVLYFFKKHRNMYKPKGVPTHGRPFSCYQLHYK